MAESKPIIGLVGRIASGKGTIATYLHTKYDGVIFTFSQILKDELTRLSLEHNRDNLIKMSEILRATYGEDILAKVIAADVKKVGAKLSVVDGIRRPADISHLSPLPGFVLVEIVAEAKTRYERLIARDEKSDDKNKTYAEFLADEERSTETSIPEISKQATRVIDNNGDLPALYRQLDTLVSSL